MGSDPFFSIGSAMPESEVSDVDEERPVSPTESDPILEKKKKAVEKAEENLRTAQPKLKSLEENATNLSESWEPRRDQEASRIVAPYECRSASTSSRKFRAS